MSRRALVGILLLSAASVPAGASDEKVAAWPEATTVIVSKRMLEADRLRALLPVRVGGVQWGGAIYPHDVSTKKVGRLARSIARAHEVGAKFIGSINGPGFHLRGMAGSEMLALDRRPQHRRDSKAKVFRCFLRPEVFAALLETAKRCVDMGMDGFVLDSWSMGGQLCFCDRCIPFYRQVLAKHGDEPGLRGIAGQVDSKTFDYGAFLRGKRVDPTLRDRKIPGGPAFRKYRFAELLREKRRFFSEVRAYAEAQVGRPFYLTANVYGMPGQTFAIDGLLDYFLVETAFFGVYNGYPPQGSSIALQKQARMVGKRAALQLANVDTVRRLIGKRSIATLMKIWVAEAYASGNLFSLSDKTHGGTNLDVDDKLRILDLPTAALKPYYAFFQAHPEIYTSKTTRSLARVGVLYSMGLGADREFRAACKLLSDAHLQFDALLVGDAVWNKSLPRAKKLSRYSALVLPLGRTPPRGAVAAELVRYVAGGGRLLLTSEYAAAPKLRRGAGFNALKRIATVPKGDPVIWRLLPYLSGRDAGLRKRFSAALGVVDVTTTNAPAEVGVLAWRAGGKTTLVHLVNYDYLEQQDRVREVESIRVRVAVRASRATLYSPDSGAATPLKLETDGDSVVFTIPKLHIYSVVVLEEEPAGILLQAEGYLRRDPDEAGFARATRERGASGGRVLARLLKRGGWCEWEFKVTQPGVRRVFVRYASNRDLQMALRLNDRDAQAKLASTGGLTGAGAYRWASLIEADLAPGTHRLRVFAAPLRLDCIWITTSPGPPPFDLPPARDRPLDASTLRQLEATAAAVRPDWIGEESGYELPRWFDAARVCAHTRLSSRWRNKPLFAEAAERLATLGFPVFSRHIKSGAEGAWWPSAVGAVEAWARRDNPAKGIIDRGHAAGLRLLVYYRHIEDRAAAKAHPDWVCRDPRGRIREAPRGPNLCMNSPYADMVERRLLELVAMGADGFYFDSIHMPREGCWCGYCRERFKREVGLEPPVAVDPADPLWRRYKDFENRTVERTFLRWRRAVHAANPECVLVIGSNTWPSLLEPHLSGRLFRIADSVKTEFNKGPVRLVGWNDAALSFGWDLSRDAADGRPAHVWVVGLVDETSALYATAGIVAHGCVANLDQFEAEIPDAGRFKKAVALGNRASAALAGTRPVPFALVHCSERARDRLWADPDKAQRAVVWPAYGAYRALLRARLPTAMITDSQLEEGVPKECRLLVLSAAVEGTTATTAPMRAAIAAFRKRGGIVVRPDRSGWRWEEGTVPEEFAQILAQLPPPPARVVGGPERLHVGSFRSKKDRRRLVVAVAQDFSFVRPGKVKTRDQRAKELDAAAVPPPVSEVHLILTGPVRPEQVLDALSGRPLKLARREGGWTVELPRFGPLALVVVEYR